MSRVYEAWRRTDAANDAEATRPDASVQAGDTPVETAAGTGEASRAVHMPATSLFPLRESRGGGEAPASDDGRPPGAWPVVPDSKARTVTFEELIRDIALDEQRMNL